MDGQDTPIHTNTILEAIAGMRYEINERFNQIDERFKNIESRLRHLEDEVEDIKKLQFSFDVQLDRLVSLNHEAISVASKSLSISHDLRADVRILRAEVRAWSQDVISLQNKAA